MQYFYLIVIYDEVNEFPFKPIKIFLQKEKAIKYGRKLASKYKVSLYRQSITTTGILEFVSHLKSFES